MDSRSAAWSQDQVENLLAERDGMIAALDSLETILFGDCWRRSRDELEARAEELVKRGE